MDIIKSKQSFILGLFFWVGQAVATPPQSEEFQTSSDDAQTASDSMDCSSENEYFESDDESENSENKEQVDRLLKNIPLEDLAALLKVYQKGLTLNYDMYNETHLYHREDARFLIQAFINMPPRLKLSAAISASSLFLLEAAINEGADTNGSDAETGTTPMHQAAEIGSPEIIQRLLAYGATWNSEDNAGRTPLDYYRIHRPREQDQNPEIIRMLRTGNTEAPTPPVLEPWERQRYREAIERVGILLGQVRPFLNTRGFSH